MNGLGEGKICSNGLFNYLGGCIGKKNLFFLTGGGKGGQEEWNSFFKCVLMNYPTIWVGAWKNNSLHMISPLWVKS